MKFETFAHRLGKRLASTRQEKKMTQVQVAREAGLSLKYVSMIESGTNPSVRTVFKVCDALGTTLEEVMEKEGIGKVAGKKTRRMQNVQVDLPTDDPEMRKLVGFIRRLETADRKRALRLIKTTFDPK
ncbi:MAG: helix-turn-helix transcriptional regulator [Deltaproteobacteria bacterium]|nr:helix-turn-helix transcriptional regulator [Deltaproteobacteria bacterium]